MSFAAVVGMLMAAYWARRYAVPHVAKAPVVEEPQPADEVRARIALVKTGTNDSGG
jgi:hypothetical protein